MSSPADVPDALVGRGGLRGLSLRGPAGATGPTGPAGPTGADGEEIELQVTASHLQSRLGVAAWANLVDKLDLDAAFATRPLLITGMSRVNALSDGAIIRAGNFAYRKLTGANVFPDAANLVPAGPDMSIGHWGLDSACSMDAAGTVTGADSTALWMSAFAYLSTFAPAGAERRPVPRLYGIPGGKARISGSVWGGIGSGARQCIVDGAGMLIYFDGEDQIGFDMTDVSSWSLINFTFIGSHKPGNRPLCYVKRGRPSNGDSGGQSILAYNTCRAAIPALIPETSPGAGDATIGAIGSFAKLAPLWEMGSEGNIDEYNVWVNLAASVENGGEFDSYAAVYDTTNSIAYGPSQTITAITPGAGPGNLRVLTIPSHGFTTGDIVVATDRQSLAPRNGNNGTQTTLEGKWWEVTVLSSNTFTLSNDDGPYAGPWGAHPDGDPIVNPAPGDQGGSNEMALCLERIPYSVHLGTDRPEPHKAHSSLVNHRANNTYDARYGNGILYQGQISGQEFINCFGVGDGMVFGVAKAGGGVPHFLDNRFDMHVETGGGAAAAYIQMLAVNHDSDTEVRFSSNSYFDNTMNGKWFMTRADPGDTLRFTNEKLTFGRLSPFAVFMFEPDDPLGDPTNPIFDSGAPEYDPMAVLGPSTVTGIRWEGGVIDLEDQSFNNLAYDQMQGALLIDKVAESKIQLPDRIRVVTNFDTLPYGGTWFNNATATGAPDTNAGWLVENVVVTSATEHQVARRLTQTFERTKTSSVWGGWIKRSRAGMTTLASNIDVTLRVATHGPTVLDTSSLSADRARNLSMTGASNGSRFLVTRTGSGAFNLNLINEGPLGGTVKALATNTWADVECDGTDWFLVRAGTL